MIRAAAPAQSRKESTQPPRRVVTLKLSSRPSGATVRNHDGGVLGQTPIALSLRSGSVARLTFAKSGYATITRRVAVGGAPQSVSVELSRSAARRGRGRH